MYRYLIELSYMGTRFRKNDFLPTAQLLLNLLESEVISEHFWPSLLVDTIPLLESKNPKIFFKETCILQHLKSNLTLLIEKKKKHMEKHPNTITYMCICNRRYDLTYSIVLKQIIRIFIEERVARIVFCIQIVAFHFSPYNLMHKMKKLAMLTTLEHCTHGTAEDNVSDDDD
uniref:Nuclear pore complex protein Nup85 n=1 Tax=Glossina austeni TaxID=7395 RepID=A0A1A9UER2_GLOAU